MAGFTLFLSFDLDVDSAEALKGEDPVARSRGLFAERAGLAKVLDVLERHGVKATFFVPGWVAARYPHLVRAITKRGHEVAAHGFMHERLDTLNREDEMRVFELAEHMIKHVTGSRPLGFRAPYWRWSSSTLEIVAKRGYLYDSSLMDDEKPYVIEHAGHKVVELPVDWRLDDWPYLEYYRTLTPRELLEMWIDEIDYAASTGGYVSLTMHPQCIGRGARIRVLDSILRRARELGAWLPRGSELARSVLGSGDS
ncbi:MAG: polysaccharide deacetylase [Desulfurococcales archaeon]|nr:polysaccharide deacetylase [Desulfurococcales archaeon]